MRTIRFLLQKEFLQIFRNRGMLPVIFIMPIIQLIILANAATFEVKNTRISLVDQDRTPTSRLLVERFEASGYFSVHSRHAASRTADDDLLRNRTKMILHIPDDFERDLRSLGRAPVQIVLNAEDGAAAGVVQSYATGIIAGFNRDIATDFVTRVLDTPQRLRLIPAHWYNPELNYTTFMVPGILVLLVTLVGMLLSAMNIVREKEIGTIEQLNVTPIGKYQFVIGKLLPFWIIALFELAFGLVIARLLFDIPIVGNVALVFALAGVYLLVVLGIGLFVSTVTNTQQQAMFVTWFLVVIFILMSGLFTPIESMPEWAQQLTRLNPLAYFMEIMRRVLLKGAGFSGVRVQFFSLVAYAAVVLTLALRQYRKVSA